MFFYLIIKSMCSDNLCRKKEKYPQIIHFSQCNKIQIWQPSYQQRIKRRPRYFLGINGMDTTSLTESIYNTSIICNGVGKNANCWLVSFPGINIKHLPTFTNNWKNFLLHKIFNERNSRNNHQIFKQHSWSNSGAGSGYIFIEIFIQIFLSHF